MEKTGKKGAEKTAYIAALCGVFTALAMIFSYVEALFPIPIGIPGVKLGLANIAVLVVLYLAGDAQALIVDILRIMLTGLLFGSFSTFLFSISGGLLSIFVMIIMKKYTPAGIVGVSVAGGVFHNIGQLAAAAFVADTGAVLFYLPVLLTAGVLTGGVNAIVAGLIKKRLHKVI